MSFAVDWDAWCDDKYLEKVRFALNQYFESKFVQSDANLPLTGLYIKKLGMKPTDSGLHDAPLAILSITDTFPGFVKYPHDDVILKMDDFIVYRSFIPEAPNPVLLTKRGHQLVRSQGAAGALRECAGTIEAIQVEGFHLETLPRHPKLGIVNRQACRAKQAEKTQPLPRPRTYVQLCRHLYNDGSVQFEMKVSLSLETSILVFTGLGLSIPLPQFAVLPIQTFIQKLFLSIQFWIAFKPIERGFEHESQQQQVEEEGLKRPWAQVYLSVKRGLENVAFSFDMEAEHTIGHVSEKQSPLKDVSELTALVKETLSRLVHMNLVYPRFIRIDLL